MQKTSAQKPVRIFVSYSRKDKVFTKNLVRNLQYALGSAAKVWFDEELSGGDEWWLRICEELTSSDICIVVWSAFSKYSRYVKDEINMAWEQRHVNENFILIPVIYKKVRDMRADLKTLQIVSFALDEYQVALNKLLRVMKIEPVTTSSKDFPLRLQAIANHPTCPLGESVAPMGIEQEFSETEENQDEMDAWRWIGEGIDALEGQYSGAMSAQFYHMRGLSYLYTDDVQRAQTMLGQALELTGEPAQRLALLDEYTSLCVAQQQWEEVVRRADEALAIDSEQPVWRLARREALRRVNASMYINDCRYAQVRPKDEQLYNNARSQPDFEDEKETRPGGVEDTQDIDTNSEEVTTKIDGSKIVANLCSQRIAPEYEYEQLALQKVRLEFEQERIMSALNMSLILAEKLYPSRSEEEKAVLARQFFPQLLPLGIREQLEISIASPTEPEVKKNLTIRNRISFTPA